MLFAFVQAMAAPLAAMPLLFGLDNVTIPAPDLEWFERNTHIFYPLLTVAAVTLLVVGILGAWRSNELSGIVKVEYKREIIQGLRRNPGGYSVEELARLVRLKSLQAAKLVEELEKDGILVSHVNTSRVKMYRLRGVGTG